MMPGADTGKSSKFQNQERVMKKEEDDPNAPKAATAEEMREARETEIATLEAGVAESTEQVRIREICVR